MLRPIGELGARDKNGLHVPEIRLTRHSFAPLLSKLTDILFGENGRSVYLPGTEACTSYGSMTTSGYVLCHRQFGLSMVPRRGSFQDKYYRSESSMDAGSFHPIVGKYGR